MAQNGTVLLRPVCSELPKSMFYCQSTAREHVDRSSHHSSSVTLCQPEVPAELSNVTVNNQ